MEYEVNFYRTPHQPENVGIYKTKKEALKHIDDDRGYYEIITWDKDSKFVKSEIVTK